MNLSNVTISKKLPIITVLLLLISGVILSGITLMKVETGFEEAVKNKLVSLVSARQSELSNFLKIIESDLRSQSLSPYTSDALGKFGAGWTVLQKDQMAKLQAAYITDNPNPAGEKHKLDNANTGSLYDRFHGSFHPYFRRLLIERSYYDILLVNKDGEVVYSVYKEADYATNLLNGKWKETDLAEIFKDVAAKPEKGKAIFKDFKAYKPSADAPASFMAMPVFKGDLFLGALIYQMPAGEINKIMQTADGMGETGETYIVGADYLMRTNSRFSKESSVLKSKNDGASVKAALAGKTGVDIITGYRGMDVVSAYKPVKFLSANWAVLAEVDVSEALETAHSVRNTSLIIMLVVTALGAVIALLFAKSITAPISKIVSSMDVLAHGDTKIEIEGSERKDEIGGIARALEVFKDNKIKADSLQAEQEKAQEEKMRRAESVDGMINLFREEVTDALDVMGNQATGMEGSSQSMSATSEETAQQATAVAAASDEAAANVQTVAGAAEELTASVNEINVQIDESSRITEEARSKAENANELVNSLNEAVSRIGEVVKMITGIAEQTNLLALNATIEAARAGDAGKGFAVVAGEVKNLANQTAKATDEIRAQINAVQSRTTDAVDAISEIAGVINQVSSISGSVVAALEEQSAATNEIARNVQEAAAGTNEVSQNIAGVNQAAREAGTTANEVLEAAKQVNEQTVFLREKVDVFLTNVQTA